MTGRLLPLAVLAVVASTVASGFVIFALPRTRTITTSPAISEPSNRSLASGAASNAAPLSTPAATISSARLPVPLLLSRHNTQFIDYTRSPETTTGSNTTEIQEAKGSSAADAKALIEADGYKDVRGLVKAPEGTWYGLAQRGATEVTISVDAKGRVSAR